MAGHTLQDTTQLVGGVVHGDGVDEGGGEAYARGWRGDERGGDECSYVGLQCAGHAYELVVEGQ